jgi:RNA polymerase sigma-70 factor (ECF subfamily)
VFVEFLVVFADAMLASEEIAAVLFSQRLPLTAYIATVTRDFHVAEDLFQDVCVKAIGRGNEFESAEHLIHWARVVGRNRGIDVLRTRDGRYSGLSDSLLATLADEWPGKPEADGRAEALSFCLERLTANNRELLRLRYFERRSCPDVASIMGRKLETVYQALARVHKSLGDCMRARLQQGG